MIKNPSRFDQFCECLWKSTYPRSIVNACASSHQVLLLVATGARLCQVVGWNVQDFPFYQYRCRCLFKMLTFGRHNPGAIDICLRDFTPGLIQPGRGFVERTN